MAVRGSTLKPISPDVVSNPISYTRRTLKFIDRYPTPKELTERIAQNGWPYKTRKEAYLTRDRALVALLYLCALRVSEALRITRDQVTIKKKSIIIEGIKLSKSHRKDKLRKSQFREYAFVPLKGERGDLGHFLQEYLALLDAKREFGIKSRLFPFKRGRAWQIVAATLGVPCHWLRAYGENFLYDAWEKDLLAVADYVKVDPQTLSQYIRRSYTKYREA